MSDFSQNLADALNALKQQETGVANAIRSKKGYPSTQKINPQDFPNEIESIQTTPTLQQKTVSPSTLIKYITPDSGYDGLSKVTVNAISPTKAAETYTPKTYNQTIPAGRWLTGVQTIKGDANLIASNIKKGVSIFGVYGTLASQNTYDRFAIQDGESVTFEEGDMVCLTYGEDDTSAMDSDGDVYIGSQSFTIEEGYMLFAVRYDGALFCFTIDRYNSSNYRPLIVATFSGDDMITTDVQGTYYLLVKLIKDFVWLGI